MRPDVAAAFDRMAAAAAADGVSLVVNSGYRSDAEQRELWERTPTRGWSRRRARRCTAAGPSSTSARPSAYGWLAANARRFGFLQRYCWEAWHYGFDAGPGAVLGRGESSGRRWRRVDADGELAGGGGLPALRARRRTGRC